MSESGEKSFDPTPKRLRDAARKGDVLRSREAATAAAMLAGAAWLNLAGPWLLENLERTLRAGFIFDARVIERFEPGAMLRDCLMLALPPVIALALPVLALTLAVQLTGEGRFIAGNIAPKGSRIDPLAGLRRMFGLTGLIEMVKGVAKVVLLGAIAAWWARDNLAAILGLGRGELAGQLALSWDALANLLYLLAAGLMVIALFDWPILWLRRRHRLRMSMQEMRDEHKEAEGSPERRAAIRQRQRQIAAGGLQHALKDAQFILANPAHFSVALCYDPAKAAAPLVLAKGRGERALAMRDVARELGLPVLEYPALARSVYFTTRERQVIREELYAAVAAVLAFVLSLKRGERPRAPVVDVPLALRFDAEGRPERIGVA